MSADNPFPEYPENPYASGEEFKRKPVEIELAEGQERGRVGQITVLGALMIVQAVLELLMAVAFVFFAFAMPEEMARQMRNDPQFQQQQNMTPEELMRAMTIGCAILGTALSVLGILTFISGFRTIRHRGRVMAIVVLSLGLVPLFSCYCFPTALALFVYGLIVLLNDPVKEAFALGEQGHTPAEIQTAFARLPLL